MAAQGQEMSRRPALRPLHVLSTWVDGREAVRVSPPRPLRSFGLGPRPWACLHRRTGTAQLADFCEGYQVRRLLEAGHTWARIAAWAGVSPQALHKKYAQAIKVVAKGPSR
jgi:hypothetical protein